MIANLVKKDFLLVKKSIVGFLGISILVPLLAIILMRNTAQIQGIGMFIFLYMVILMELSFMQAIAAEEEKSSKAVALLFAAPYPRKSYVIAKYICYLIFYGGCLFVYSIIAAVYPGFDFLNISGVLAVFLAGATLYGIYMTVVIKYGATRAWLVFFIAILFASLGPTIVTHVFRTEVKLILSLMQRIPGMMISVILGIAGMGVFLISVIISIRIFVKKEL